jgi:triosephosphate isomerase (TIM)
MHKTIAEAVALADALVASSGTVAADREVVICPTYTALASVAGRLAGSSIGLGAQNVYPEPQGAFTGEISPAMLRDVGCRYVIVGHSERRQLFAESDAMVARKAAAVLQAGMTPIICVGETRSERESGQAEHVVLGQVQGSLAGLTAHIDQVVIAYEPVWAIGTGLTATAADAQAMHAAIRGELRGTGRCRAHPVRRQCQARQR